MTDLLKPSICPDSTYGRVYKLPKDEKGVDGPYVASVTTITSHGLPMNRWLFKWHLETSKGSWDNYIAFNGAASEIGTKVHELFDRMLHGEEIVIGDDPAEYLAGDGYYPTQQHLTEIKKGLQSATAFWKHNNPTLITSEELLWSTERADDGSYLYPFCGRVDLICMIDGKNGPERWLLDLKTSKQVTGSLAYQLQLVAYKLLWDSMHPDQKIDRLGVIHANKTFKRNEPPVSCLLPIEYPFTPELFYNAYALFYEVYDGFKLGQPKRKVATPNVFSIA